MKTQTSLALLWLVLTLAPLSTLFGQGTAIHYQGVLEESGAPANGRYDFSFQLWDGPGIANQVELPVATNAVPVSNGLFSVVLDFAPPAFLNGTRWLEISVKSNAVAGPFTVLTPRQQVFPAPYAIFASSAGSASALSGSVPPAGLTGDYVNKVQFTHPSNQFTGNFIGNGSGLTGLNAWALSGNAGTTPGTQFLGTSDVRPLTFKVNGATALRIDPATFGPNIIGGLAARKPTVVGAGVRGAVVAGGGAPAGPVDGFGGGDFFAVYDSDGAIGGGFGNKVGTDDGNAENSPFATVAGGVFNTAANYAATVAGGDGNYAAGSRSAIGGGFGNQVISALSVIAGGLGNFIQTNSSSATISGGQNNSVSPGGLGYVSAKGASIGGGEGNTIFGFGQFPETALYNEYGTISGGYSNKVEGSYGTVPGGYLNTASGEFSLAAGRRAKANHNGSFVWADTQNADFASTSENQFNIRAANGVRLNTDTSLFFGSSGTSKLWPDQGGAIELGNSTAAGVTPYIDFHYGFGSAQDFNIRIMNDGPETLSIFRSGSATRMAQFSPAGLSVNGTFVSTSDRNSKENFKPVNSRDVLEKVAALPFSRWNYKDDKASEHIGPMAQDFYAAFGVGPDDKHIATVDADGVALAAIQGLNQKVEEKNAEIRDLKRELEQLKQIVDKLANH